MEAADAQPHVGSATAPLPPSFATALVAGGLAGTTVDVALFPIDTLKTRLQAPQGFWAAGGVRGIYRGVWASFAGSAPGAALFFATYETLKPKLDGIINADGAGNNSAVVHMTAASLGEAAACCVRVPTEVVKGRMQVAQDPLTLGETVRTVLAERPPTWMGQFTGGLYRGYGITLFREVPFAMIQFPLYERLKRMWGERQGGDGTVSPFAAASCGSAAGAVAAAATTPLDVIKTRLMLGVDKHGKPYHGARDVLQRTVEGEGKGALFNGIQPRVIWISLGGFVFFGAYETFKGVVSPIMDSR